MKEILSFIAGLLTGLVTMVGVSIYMTRWAFRHPQKVLHLVMNRGRKKSAKNAAQNGGLPPSVFGPMMQVPRGFSEIQVKPDRD